MREYEKATQARLPATGEYFLQNSVYTSWKQSQLDVQDNNENLVPLGKPKILFVKGALLLGRRGT